MPAVLFVSPDRDLRAAASRVLTMAGCHVTAAAGAGQAARACRDGRQFDVLVIEDLMADGTVGAIARRLRRYCPGLWVVRMCDVGSALWPAEIALVRPFDAYDLIAAVSDVVHTTRRRATTL